MTAALKEGMSVGLMADLKVDRKVAWMDVN